MVELDCGCVGSCCGICSLAKAAGRPRLNHANAAAFIPTKLNTLKGRVNQEKREADEAGAQRERRVLAASGGLAAAMAAAAPGGAGGGASDAASLAGSASHDAVELPSLYETAAIAMQEQETVELAAKVRDARSREATKTNGARERRRNLLF